MNNTIFRRKIVFGMLIAFVLGIGVQNVADAALTAEKRSGDLQVRRLAPNVSFEFSFSISGVPGSRTQADKGRESITITSPDMDIVEVRMGATRYTATGHSFTLTERHGDDTGGDGDLASGTVYVKCTPASLGEYIIRVTDNASPAGFTQLMFSAYGIRPPVEVQDVRFANAVKNPLQRIAYPNESGDYVYDEVVSLTVTGTNSDWVFIDFVVEGPGYIYDDLDSNSQPDPGKSPTKTLTTFTKTKDVDGASVASVRLQMKGGTNKITASIRYTEQAYVVTYLYQNGETISPPQPGARLTVNAPVSGTLGQTVTVTATASGKTTNSGQSVAFSSNRGGTFSPSVSTTNGSGVATTQFTLPSAAGDVIITASATNYARGTATVNVSAGNTLTVTPNPIIKAPAGQRYNIVVNAGTQGVLVTLSGLGFQSAQGTTVAGGSVTIPVMMPNNPDTIYKLYADAAGYTRALIPVTVAVGETPTTGVSVQLIIPSGTNRIQTVAIGSNATLRVRVTRTGANAVQSGVAVTFRDSSGNALPSGTVTTNSSGEATYQLAVSSTARRLITAVITDTNVDTSSATPVTFEITGTVRQPTQSTLLNIIQTRNTGAPGAPYPLTILMVTQNGAAAVNQVVTLTVRNSAQALISTTQLITGANGRATTPDTFRLPTAAGQYTITAVSGTQTRSVTVTVVPINLLKDTSDSVSGDNQEGDRGKVLDEPFMLKVVQVNTAQTPMQGVPVTFTVVDGDGELSDSSSATSGNSSLTVQSDANGEVRAYLVLDRDDEDNRVRASVGITNVADVFFDATGAVVPYDIEIVSGNNQRGIPNRYLDRPLVVRVTDEDGDDLQGVTVTFSLRGSGTLTRSAETDRNGEAEADFLPRTAGIHYIDARVTGVTSVRFTITVGELADDLEIVSGNNQRGNPGSELDDPFVVEVLDDNGNTVSGVTVTFSVTAGGGRLSATSVTTNSRGRAQTYLTLGNEPGRNSVRASVSGVSDRVTFTATSTPPEPDIRLPASQRADMYWIDTENGTLHRLVGDRVENIAPGVTNVVSLVVTSNRLYWVEKTGNNSGRIRRSNLNGSNIQLIRDLTALPAGITVDTANSKIYLTNGFGKVQAINLDGSGYVPSLVRNLSDPKDIAVGSGKIYWITNGGTVEYANVDGSEVTQLSRGYDTLRSIAVGGGKVFWTEETGESSGKIHSANLDGSGVKELVSLLATPYGISVDTANKKLYFTNSRGRVMQSDLSGNSVETVVANLVSPGDLSVFSGTTRAPGTFSRYDVNRDGKVDNTDAALVANALGESPPSNPRLDVNGDGVVNFLDLLLVFDNRDESNAAPVAVAKERPKVSREEVQHQIDLLLATDNHAATAQFTLAYLQSLLEVVTPEQTRLLANYPNPFNPETWIPYQLSTSSNVQMTIYNSAGKEVRTLSLGHQSEGYYTDRSRAAYWDGRNAIGEPVSSGVYFYTLTTDRMSATRKMLILK